MQLVIGLIGVKRAGKDSVYNIIEEFGQENRDVLTKRVGFADAIKKVSSEALDVPLRFFEEDKLKEKELEDLVVLDYRNVAKLIEPYGVDFSLEHVRPHVGKILRTPREVAQYVGTEVLRNVDTNIHMYGAHKKVLPEGVTIITDMRFPSEKQYFEENFKDNFVSVFVHRRSAEALSAQDSHASEREILKLGAQAQWTIDNNFSQNELKKNTLQIFDAILDSKGI